MRFFIVILSLLFSQLCYAENDAEPPQLPPITSEAQTSDAAAPIMDTETEQSVDSIHLPTTDKDVESASSNNTQPNIKDKKAEKLPSNNNKSLQDRDHLAQIWMAWAAWAGVLLGIVGSLLLLFTLRYTRDAAKSANETLKQTKLALQNDRGWIVIDTQPHGVIKSYEITDPTNTSRKVYKDAFYFQIGIKNRGRTPARELRCEIESKLVPVDENTPIFSTTILSNEKSSFIPSDGIAFTSRRIFYGKDAEKIRNKTHIVYIFLRCEYKTLFDDKIRYTRTTFKCALEGSNNINGEVLPLFNLSTVGKQRCNT